VGGVIDRLLARGRELARLCGGDVNMEQQIQAEEERTLAMRVETDAAERDQLAQSGFSNEEIVALLWLRRWYQTGGSDRMELLRHWEFLKWLVRASLLEGL
jgi:hypothetical protein